MIIGPDFDEVAGIVARGNVWTVRRTSSVAEFAALMDEQADDSIERLDIVSHGGQGHINMGEGIALFKSDGSPTNALVAGDELASTIRGKLTPAAQVRMLGCETAGSWFGAPVGRFLLLKLARKLNPPSDAGTNRMVFGTIDGVEPQDFEPEGLRRQREISLLFSSYTAIDFDCPTAEIRSNDISDIKAASLRVRRWIMAEKLVRQCAQIAREILTM